MSAVAASSPSPSPSPSKGGMSKTRKILWSIAGVYILGIVVLVAVFGIKGHKNETFKVIDAFHLETWFHIAGPLNFDKGVLYLLIATAISIIRRRPTQSDRWPATNRLATTPAA